MTDENKQTPPKTEDVTGVPPPALGSALLLADWEDLLQRLDTHYQTACDIHAPEPPDWPPEWTHAKLVAASGYIQQQLAADGFTVVRTMKPNSEVRRAGPETGCKKP